MRRRMCDVEGCLQDGVFIVRVTAQPTREVQQARDNREWEEGEIRPDYLGEMDVCDAHAVGITLGEIHRKLDQQVRARAAEAGQNQGPFLGRPLLAGTGVRNCALAPAPGGQFIGNAAPQVAEGGGTTIHTDRPVLVEQEGPF